MTDKLAYTGVDYIRLTANDHQPFEHWEALLLPVWEVEAQLGRKQHYRWILGYFGRVGEHCFVGKNDSGCMVQISGAEAWQHWYEAGCYSSRCTRIDLQVTYPVEGEPGEYIREMYAVGKMAPKVNGRPPELQLTDTPRGAKMLTVGSRQSQVYGRMYDKGRESKMPEYKGCVRWEIEAKAETAVDLNAYMREHKSEAPTTRAIVHQFWERHGMTPFWDTFESLEGKPPVKRSKTDETKIAWLAAQVRPTLQGLKERGKLKLALRALFGEELPEESIALIEQLLTL